MNELERTKQWFEIAIPEPTDEQKCIQIGCHIEEFHEMLWSMSIQSSEIQDAEGSFKGCEKMAMADVKFCNKKELLDSLVDQIVTAMGVGHMMGFDMIGALQAVNSSNYSKFEDGKAVFDKNGKIKKGKHYFAPKLDAMINNR